MDKIDLVFTYAKLRIIEIEKVKQNIIDLKAG